MKTLRLFGTLLLTLLLSGGTGLIQAQTDTGEQGYKIPPKQMADIILAPAVPTVSFSPLKNKFAVFSINDLPTNQEQSREDVRLAGQRVLVSTNSPLVKSVITQIEIKNLPGQNGFQGIIRGFGEDARILHCKWSPDGNYLAAALEEADGVYLWIADVNSGTAHRCSDRKLNLFFGPNLFQWTPDSKSVTVPLIPENRPLSPKARGKEFPATPTIQESSGQKGGVRTYQDLLTDKYDEYLFDYYATSSLATVSPEGTVKKIGKDAVYTYYSYSPDGKYMLVRYVYRPYSYQVGYNQFPNSLELWDKNGRKIDTIITKELSVGNGREEDKEKRSGFDWRPDKAASLYWYESYKVAADSTAKDTSGDKGSKGKKPKTKTYKKIMEWNAPFDAQAQAIFYPDFNIRRIHWCDSLNIFVSVTNEKEKKDELYFVKSFTNTSRPRYEGDTLGLVKTSSLDLIYSVKSRDLYASAGTPVTMPNKYGNETVYSPDKYATVYFSNPGYSAAGAYPYMTRYNLKKKLFTTVWSCRDPYYEEPVEFLDLKKGIFITKRESQEEFPNYLLLEDFGKKDTRLTSFQSPIESIVRNIKKQTVEYYREDSVLLRGTLYTPADYKGEEPLPLFIWAYPAEYRDKELAQQRRDSPNKYTTISRSSILMIVPMGYAVLNDASFPIIGSEKVQPNDNYIKDLVNNAKAAIKKVADMGIGDSTRVAVGGHSYGAFMTANLLAHSELFAAGIARSGAYNRTLTPFGFQNESRNFWKAKNVYMEMSPFAYADKIKSPILLVHGLDDNNPGTFTIQSIRLYAAIQGNGGTVRLVLLPYESHGYSTKENLLQLGWETYRHLDKYVKNRQPAQKAGPDEDDDTDQENNN